MGGRPRSTRWWPRSTRRGFFWRKGRAGPRQASRRPDRCCQDMRYNPFSAGGSRWICASGCRQTISFDLRRCFHWHCLRIFLLPPPQPWPSPRRTSADFDRAHRRQRAADGGIEGVPTLTPMEAQCVGKCDDVASAGRLMGPEGPPTSPLNAPVAERRPCRSSSQITKRCGFSLRHLRVGTLVQRFRHDCAQPKVHAAFNPKEPVLRSCRRFLAASTRLRRVWHDVRACVLSLGGMGDMYAR